MSILLSRMCVVPTGFVVVGLVALSSPPIRAGLGVDADAQDLMRMDSDKG